MLAWFALIPGLISGCVPPLPYPGRVVDTPRRVVRMVDEPEEPLADFDLFVYRCTHTLAASWTASSRSAASAATPSPSRSDLTWASSCGGLLGVQAIGPVAVEASLESVEERPGDPELAARRGGVKPFGRGSVLPG